MDIHDKVELLDPRSLTPYPNNHKIHSERDIARLAEQIKAFGFDQPIVVDSQKVVIKGHKRRMAAISLGLSEVPVIVSPLPRDQVIASRIADNQAVGTHFDQKQLGIDIKKLSDSQTDLGLTGFDMAEIDLMLAQSQSQNERAMAEHQAAHQPPPVQQPSPAPGDVGAGTQDAGPPEPPPAGQPVPEAAISQPAEDAPQAYDPNPSGREAVLDDDHRDLKTATPIITCDFGGERVPLSEAEHQALCQRLADFVAENGTRFGFFASLLREPVA